VSNSAGIPQGTCPVVIDKTLLVNYFENVDVRNWRIKVTDHNIRLVSTSSTSNRQITVISDSFFSRDWAPETGLCFETDTLLNYFCSGESPSISEWTDLFNKFLPSSRLERNVLYEKKNKDQHGIFDRKKLRNLMIRQHELLSGSSKSAVYERLKESDKEYEMRIVDDYSRSMLMSLVYGEVSFDASDERLLNHINNGDGDEELSDGLLVNSSSFMIDGDEIKEWVDQLTNSMITTAEWNEMRDFNILGMASKNNFFKGVLIHLGDIYPECSFREVQEGSLSNVMNPWGKLLSFAFMIDMEDDSPESVEMNDISEEGDLEEVEFVSFHSRKSESAILDRIRALDELYSGSIDSVTKIQARRLISRNNKLLADLKRRQGKKHQVINNIADVRKRDFVPALVKAYSNRYSDRYNILSVLEGEIANEDDKTIVTRLYNIRARSAIGQLESTGIFDSGLASHFRDSLESSFLNESFVELACIMTNTEIFFEEGGEELYSMSSSIPLDEQQFGHMTMKIVYTCDDRACEFRMI
jgi:hypothetical protein